MRKLDKFSHGEDDEIEDDKDLWRKRAPCKVDLQKPLLSASRSRGILLELRGDVELWKGWPFFDIKIIQFELNSFVRSMGRPYN